MSKTKTQDPPKIGSIYVGSKPKASDNLSLIAQMAKDPQVSADKLEQLINLHNSECERQRKEEAFRDLASLKFDLPHIKKSRSVDGRYNYSPMDDLMRQIGGLMREHNITATYSHGNENGPYTECYLLHRNGYQFDPVRTHVAKPPTNRLLTDTQAMGVMNSYGERYALKSALGLVFTDEDTDGIVEQADTGPSVTEQLEALLFESGRTHAELNSAIEKKSGKSMEGKSWKEQGDTWKQRVIDAWSTLEFE